MVSRIKPQLDLLSSQPGVANFFELQVTCWKLIGRRATSSILVVMLHHIESEKLFFSFLKIQYRLKVLKKYCASSKISIRD